MSCPSLASAMLLSCAAACVPWGSVGVDDDVVVDGVDADVDVVACDTAKGAGSR